MNRIDHSFPGCQRKNISLSNISSPIELDHNNWRFNSHASRRKVRPLIPRNKQLTGQTIPSYIRGCKSSLIGSQLWKLLHEKRNKGNYYKTGHCRWKKKPNRSHIYIETRNKEKEFMYCSKAWRERKILGEMVDITFLSLSNQGGSSGVLKKWDICSTLLWKPPFIYIQHQWHFTGKYNICCSRTCIKG